MGYVLSYVWKVVLIAAGFGVTWALASVAGPWLGLGIWALAMGVACAVAAYLLSRAPVGQITWRNRLSGFFIPWGYALGRGRLVPITAVAWVTWVLIGLSAVLLFRFGSSAVSTPVAPAAIGDAHPAIAVCLFACWALYAALILRLLGLTSARQSILKLMLVLLALIGASVALWLNGRPGAALLVAAGPIVAIGGGYGLLLCVMLASGKNARWN